MKTHPNCWSLIYLAKARRRDSRLATGADASIGAIAVHQSISCSFAHSATKHRTKPSHHTSTESLGRSVNLDGFETLYGILVDRRVGRRRARGASVWRRRRRTKSRLMSLAKRMTPTTHRYRRPLIQTLATVLVTMMLCSFVMRARAFSRCRTPVPATSPCRPKRTVHHSPLLRMKPNSYEQMEDPNSFSLSGYQRPKVNWYPGHIAKAERQLAETLKSVDVVIEVRDSRAPKATAHPSVGKWAAGRPRVVVLTRVDTVTTRSRETWRQAYERLGADRWQEKLAGDERNRNAQFETERRKYVDGEDGDSVNLRGADGVEEVRRCDS